MPTETTTQAPAASAATNDETLAAAPAKPKRRGVFILVLVVIAIAIGIYWLSGRNKEETDDAQIDSHLNPIASRVDGTILAVHVEDNQAVNAGDPIAELDTRDFDNAVADARAQLDQAQAQFTAQGPNLPITQTTNQTDLSSARAQLTNADAALTGAQHDYDSAVQKLNEAQANNDREQADLARYTQLISKQEVSRQEYDQHVAAAKAQSATVASAQASAASAAKVVEQRRAQLSEQQSKLEQTLRNAPRQVAIQQANINSRKASAESAQAQLDKALLNLSYTRITAPVTGVVTQRSAEIGARVSAGQQLLMIVQTGNQWVTANYKETQLEHMRPGQHASIKVDALNEKFTGSVESMPAITGSRSSVLPPENATGNYVKVIQRLPVRIRIDPGQRDLDKLRPGMSVETSVTTN